MTPIVVYGPTSLGGWFQYDDAFFSYGWDLNDSDDKMGFGFHFSKTGVITEVGFTIENIIGSCPTDYQIGVVTLDPSTGYPTDTLYSNASWQNFNPYTYGSGWSWITWSGSINVTASDHTAVVIKPGATSPDSSNYFSIIAEELWYGKYPTMYRYSTSWTDDEAPGPAAMKYSDGDLTGYPVLDLATIFIQSPEEWGVEFTLPVKSECVGAAVIHQEGDDVPYNILLTDSNDTALRTYTVTNSTLFGYNYSSDHAFHMWENIELQAGTPYRLVIKPTAANYFTCVAFEMVSEADKEALPGGTDWKWIHRLTPTSGWSYSPAKYPWISLLLTNLGGSMVENSYGFIG